MNEQSTELQKQILPKILIIDPSSDDVKRKTRH